MSVENDDLQIVQPEEKDTTFSKQSKISYTREFLLSFSELEDCKRLPKGFDKSLLSEFENAYYFIQDRPRISGNPQLQGFRRNDYGSSPPGKGEMDNFSRGFQRWDSRSSGRSDTDSQSDRDSDSGRRYGNQYRRPWQNSEHDGLLGRGSYPRSPGYGPGTAVQRFRANDQHQLSRSNDPYHPPRPYKAVPHSRREVNDSYNDETFGSAECTSDDRVEEERKRRAEFEMMRKEQQKELQKKLKLKSVDKINDDPLSELAGSSDTRDAKMANGLVEPVMKQIQQSNSRKISVSSQGQPSRPLVPPGFANTTVEKFSASKSLSHSDTMSVPELGDDNKEEKAARQLGICENHSEITSSLASKDGMKVDLSSVCKSIQATVPDDRLLRASNSADISSILDNGKTVETGSENVTKDKIMGEAGHPTSLFEQLFSGTLSTDGGNVSNNVEDHNMMTDNVWNPKDLRSSKFAHLFLEEEKKQEDRSSEKSNDLLSLIVGEKSRPVASEPNTMQEILPLESNLVKMVSTPKFTNAGISEPLRNKYKSETISTVLTCEDLEQSVLLKMGGSSSSSQPPAEICSSHAAETEKPDSNINNSASQHLLSLLQKGTSPNLNTVSPISMLDKASPRAYQDSESGRIVGFQDNIRDANGESIGRSRKELTLETLFGTDFMKELQSLDAPVSEKGNPAGAASIDVSETSKLPFAVTDDDVSTASVSEPRSQMVNLDGDILRLGGAHQINLEKVGINWLSFDSSQIEVDSSKLPSEMESNSGAFNGPNGVRLPEEDRLIGLNDPANAQSSFFMANLNVANPEVLPSSSNGPVGFAEKLASLAALTKDERPIAQGQDGPPFRHGLYDMMKLENPYPKMHAYSSPQFNPTPMNHGRPTFHLLDSHTPHIDPKLNFMPPEGIIHHDGPSHHRFPAQLHHSPQVHPNNVLPDSNHPINPMLQHMRMPNNLPLPHLPHGFPGGAQRNSSNPPVYIPEHNPVQGLPFGQWQQNLDGLGMPPRGPELGGINNHPPESFQRLLEMELRSNPKPMHPSFPAAGGHARPMYGHELDAGFLYR